MYSLIVFIAGLAIGSFLNVVIFRLENGEKIINDRSRCLRCRHTLAWYDLVPVLSFIFLKGKCRYCGKRISWQYPMVELSTAILFVVLISNIQYPISSQYQISNIQFLDIAQFLSLLFWFFITSVLIVVFVYDLKHYIIPDKIIYPAIIVALGFNLFSNFHNSLFLNNIFAAFIASLFFLSIVVITKGKGMGGGDIKLAFLMGLILGWPIVIFSVFFAFISGSVVGIYLILAGKKKMKSMIPFGPFLIFGTFVGMFWGREIMEWYLDRII